MTAEAQKRHAAKASLAFVEPGMVVGLGTGSSAALLATGRLSDDRQAAGPEQHRGLRPTACRCTRVHGASAP